MKTIRRGVFETNSSSTHSISIVAKEDYDRWEKGEVLFDKRKSAFVPVDKIEEYRSDPKNKYCKLETSEEYFENEYLEGFEETYITKSGDEVVAFGMYGYDG